MHSLERQRAWYAGLMATVLLVDDTTEVRETLRLWAEARGLEVVGEAATGREAVDLAARLRPDVIVLDQEMPEMTGLEALPRLRRRVPESVIIFYAANATWLLIASNVFLANSCVALTCPYQTLPPALDWPAASARSCATVRLVAPPNAPLVFW